MDYSIIEASLIKADSIPAPSHLANIRVHLNEIFAKVIIALCEGGSNSPTLFPGDEMFESELEESFIFVTHSTVRFRPIKFIPSMEDLPELQIYIHTYIRWSSWSNHTYSTNFQFCEYVLTSVLSFSFLSGAEDSYVTDLHGF